MWWMESIGFQFFFLFYQNTSTEIVQSINQLVTSELGIMKGKSLSPLASPPSDWTKLENLKFNCLVWLIDWLETIISWVWKYSTKQKTIVVLKAHLWKFQTWNFFFQVNNKPFFVLTIEMLQSLFWWAKHHQPCQLWFDPQRN